MSVQIHKHMQYIYITKRPDKVFDIYVCGKFHVKNLKHHKLLRRMSPSVTILNWSQLLCVFVDFVGSGLQRHSLLLLSMRWPSYLSPCLHRSGLLSARILSWLGCGWPRATCHCLSRYTREQPGAVVGGQRQSLRSS